MSDIAVMRIVLIALLNYATRAALAADFVQTPIRGRDCELSSIDSDHPADDGDFQRRTCPGRGDYRLQVDIVDARGDVVLLGSHGEAHRLGLPEWISHGRLSEVRGAAWWMRGKVPGALIVHLGVQHDLEPGPVDVVHFVVAKVLPEAICVVFDEHTLAAAKRRAPSAADAPCVSSLGRTERLLSTPSDAPHCTREAVPAGDKLLQQRTCPGVAGYRVRIKVRDSDSVWEYDTVLLVGSDGIEHALAPQSREEFGKLLGSVRWMMNGEVPIGLILTHAAVLCCLERSEMRAAGLRVPWVDDTVYTSVKITPTQICPVFINDHTAAAARRRLQAAPDAPCTQER